MVWARSGPGLSPGPQSHAVFHITTIARVHSNPPRLDTWHLTTIFNLALLCVEVWSHDPYAQRLAVRGIGSLTILQFAQFFGYAPSARF
jgi:hypothetical protein